MGLMPSYPQSQYTHIYQKLQQYIFLNIVRKEKSCYATFPNMSKYDQALDYTII